MARHRVLIADDEPLARENLRSLVQCERDLLLVGEARTGTEVLRLVRRECPDVLFLDVEMPGMNGVEAVQSLGMDHPLVIFVTAFTRYAPEAFDVDATDYLLKPFDPERFQRCLRRARSRLTVRPPAASPHGVGHLRRLIVPAGSLKRIICVEDVDWFGANDNYIDLHVGERVFNIRESLTALVNRLDPAMFSRIHRSTIVNLDRVRKIFPLRSGDGLVRLVDGTELRMSRSYGARFESGLTALL